MKPLASYLCSIDVEKKMKKSKKTTEIKFTKAIDNALTSWSNSIEIALHEGKGKYSRWMVKDLFDFKKIIDLIDRGENDDEPLHYVRAASFWASLDTDVRDAVPNRIYNFLQEIERSSRVKVVHYGTVWSSR